MTPDNFSPTGEPSPQNQVEKISPIAEILNSPDEKEVKEIKAIDTVVFPPEMTISEDVVDAFLNNPKSALSVLRMPDGSIAGYMVADPLEEAFEDLKEHDPDMKMLSNAAYIESMAILPGYRSFRNMRTLYDCFLQSAKNKGYKTLTMHARTTTGLSDFLQKRAGAKLKRRLENWYDFGEAFDYLVIEI
jgi:hypothetical protein